MKEKKLRWIHAPVNTSLESNVSQVLKQRAEMLANVRQFFAKRHVLEVDCPALSLRAPIDVHIDVMQVHLQNGECGYLHTSPEYGMKRLLARGSGDIYQLSHVFRDGESGHLHNPEFTMIEWYRLGFSLNELIEETLQLIRLFVDSLEVNILSYSEAFRKYAGIDAVAMTAKQLKDYIRSQDFQVSEAILSSDKDTLLQLILTQLVEPHLGEEGLCVLADFPASQAALAQIKVKQGEEIAERFEVYYQGLELANGYHELLDAKEQKKRLVQANEERKKKGKPTLPIDHYFLEALELGLPDCSGVAVGFDRLLMLKLKKLHLQEVLAFPWPLA